MIEALGRGFERIKNSVHIYESFRFHGFRKKVPVLSAEHSIRAMGKIWSAMRATVAVESLMISLTGPTSSLPTSSASFFPTIFVQRTLFRLNDSTLPTIPFERAIFELSDSD